MAETAAAKTRFRLASVVSCLWEIAVVNHKSGDTHVDASAEMSRDGGSIPPASTQWNRKPFGEHVEGLSYCRA